LVEGVAATIVESVVLAMGPFIRGDYIGLEGAGLVQATQRSIYGGIAYAIQTALAQPAENVIAVAVVLGENGEDGQVQNAL
jgi:hypothetical protein